VDFTRIPITAANRMLETRAWARQRHCSSQRRDRCAGRSAYGSGKASGPTSIPCARVWPDQPSAPRGVTSGYSLLLARSE